MQTKNNHFKIETKTRLRSIITDDMRLRQILLNLVGNAAKFTENGSIRLVVSEAGASGRIDFSVIDTGIGMTEEQVAGLFQRFQQADQSTIRKYGGTGLGLALTKALAGLLGGEIRVTSEPGVGTTAIVSLPILSEQINDNADVPTIASNQPDFSQRHDGLRILIVDDEAGAREHLYRVLSREGFNVATCADATTAVETAATFAPAAILLDVMMPRMDGWQVLQHLRADPRTADIPVIMQTLLDAEHVAFALGANGYLRKPLDRSSILQALAGVKTVDKPAAMIIDDDPEARRRIMRVLRRDGWTVTEFGDGKSALDALDTWHPDVVVVDLVMPVMDGHAFIHAVRNQPKWRDLPIVVLTAEDIADVQVDSLTGMTAEVVQKGSMPLAELVSRLRRHAPAGNVSTQTELAGA